MLCNRFRFSPIIIFPPISKFSLYFFLFQSCSLSVTHIYIFYHFCIVCLFLFFPLFSLLSSYLSHSFPLLSNCLPLFIHPLLYSLPITYCSLNHSSSIPLSTSLLLPTVFSLASEILSRSVSLPLLMPLIPALE